MAAMIQKATRKIMGTPVHVFIMAAIIAGTLFLLLLDNYKQYQTDISIIVIPKSTVATLDHQMIVYNIKQMPTTLAFYDRLLAENAAIKDGAAGKSADLRKSAWNRKIDVDLSDSDKGSIITLRLYADTAQGSQDLAVKTAQTLFSFTSKYYNIKDDINMHVIDQPITKPAQTLAWIFALVSIVVGFLLAWLVEKMFILVESVFRQPSAMTARRSHAQKIHADLTRLKESITKADIKIKSVEDIYRTDEEIVVEHPHHEKQEHVSHRAEEKRLQEMYPNFPEMPMHHPTASAPSNLPVGEEVVETPESSQQESEDVTHMKDHEPTEEEIKKRLNQLLRGEM